MYNFAEKGELFGELQTPNRQRKKSQF